MQHAMSGTIEGRPSTGISEGGPLAAPIDVELELDLDDSDLEHVTGGLARLWNGVMSAPGGTA